MCIRDSPGVAGRHVLLNQPWSHWRDVILAELAGPHPDLAAKVTRIDITRYGHAMAMPIPGFTDTNRLWRTSNKDKALLQSKQYPLTHGHLSFAHSDWAGYSVFEEAFTPVSYTHLDVYKRQNQATGLPAAAGADNAGASVLSIDYSGQAPTVTLGQPVLLEDLQLTGLRDASVKTETGRQFNCPHCGAAVAVTLATSQSITCAACNSLIDLSQGCLLYTSRCV